MAQYSPHFEAHLVCAQMQPTVASISYRRHSYVERGDAKRRRRGHSTRPGRRLFRRLCWGCAQRRERRRAKWGLGWTRTGPRRRSDAGSVQLPLLDGPRCTLHVPPLRRREFFRSEVLELVVRLSHTALTCAVPNCSSPPAEFVDFQKLLCTPIYRVAQKKSYPSAKSSTKRNKACRLDFVFVIYKVSI